MESPNPLLYYKKIKQIKQQKLPINQEILEGQIMESPTHFLRKRSSFNEVNKEDHLSGKTSALTMSTFAEVKQLCNSEVQGLGGIAFSVPNKTTTPVRKRQYRSGL